MQQPFEQYVFAGHSMFAPQTVVPVGQVCVPLHSAGSELGSCPGHRMQVSPPHSVGPQPVLFTQRKHFVGSARFSSVHSGDVDGFVAMS